ncbi:MAG: transposase [Pedobacter sp.]|jgi:hypothetical protein
MNIAKGKEFRKILQVKLYKFINYLSVNLTEPERIFNKDMITGILKSQSCTVRQAAISLEENISVEKTTERLRNHLSKPQLGIELKSRLIKKSAKKINHDTIIAVDDSDIMKEYAKKMEGLHLVPDGSNGHKRGLGYKLMNIAGVNEKGENDIEVLPLMSELFSDKSEIDTSSNILYDQINDIQIASKNKGIFTFDRYYDDKKLFKYLTENDADYITRAKPSRKLYINGIYKDFIDVAKLVNLDIVIRVDGGGELEAGAIQVEIPVNPHHRKVPETVKVWLIVARYLKKPKGMSKREKESEEKGGYFYLYVNIRHLNNDRKAIILKSIKGYKLRWKIEEFHRHVKKDFGWEDMQLMEYDRLKNMNILLLAALTLIYSLYKYRFTLYQVFSSMMLDRERDKKKVVFIYYRITKVVRYLLTSWRLRKRVKYKGKNTEYLQLRLSF